MCEGPVGGVRLVVGDLLALLGGRTDLGGEKIFAEAEVVLLGKWGPHRGLALSSCLEHGRRKVHTVVKHGVISILFVYF